MKNKGSNHLVTASALILIKYVTGFLSEPNKVKIKVLFTQEIMGDDTWPRQGSSSKEHHKCSHWSLTTEHCQHRDQTQEKSAPQ